MNEEDYQTIKGARDCIWYGTNGDKPRMVTEGILMLDNLLREYEESHKRLEVD